MWSVDPWFAIFALASWSVGVPLAFVLGYQYRKFMVK